MKTAIKWLIALVLVATLVHVSWRNGYNAGKRMNPETTMKLIEQWDRDRHNRV